MSRSSFKTIIAGLSVFLFTHCGFFSDLAVDPAKTPSSLSGRVVDSLSGAGIAGVAVVLQGESVHETVTDADGAFRFSDLFTGEKKLEISMTYYHSCSMDLKLTADGEEALTIRMVRQNSAPAIVRTVYPGQVKTDIPLTMRFKWELSDPDFSVQGSREVLFYVFTMDSAGIRDSGFLPAPASGTSLTLRAPSKMITGLKPLQVYHWKLVLKDCLNAVSAYEDSFTTRPDFGPQDSICPDDMALVEVEDRAFCMDRYEMTNEKYLAENPLDSNNVSKYSWQTNMPATKVTLFKAGATCVRLQKRLCTADEWKAAAIGWEDWNYPYGREYDGSKCNTEKLAFQSTSDSGGADTVGQNPECVSPFGIYDLSGNVAEWVGYNSTLPYLRDSLGYYTIFYMGGSWSSRDQSGINSKRPIKTGSQAYSQEDIGFRCCKNPQQGF